MRGWRRIVGKTNPTMHSRVTWHSQCLEPGDVPCLQHFKPRGGEAGLVERAVTRESRMLFMTVEAKGAIVRSIGHSSSQMGRGQV